MHYAQCNHDTKLHKKHPLQYHKKHPLQYHHCTNYNPNDRDSYWNANNEGSLAEVGLPMSVSAYM